MKAINRVAVNTIIQYVKLVVSLLVGLITVRVLLAALGADDYGIYDVVGGIIALLAFINSSLSQSSIRFISVSLGEHNSNTTNKVFNNCFWVHFFVSICIVVLFELLGPVLLNHFLTIPESRLSAAKDIYQFMIFILFLQISISPFNALIVSHEKFVFLSIIAIIDSILKLGIAFIIKYSQLDKLILYGALMAGVTVLNSIMSVGYVSKQYRNEGQVRAVSLSGAKELLNFVGWTIMDVLSQVSTRQGYAIVFNKFFGTTINAAYAISRQVEGNMYYVSASVIDSMKPQIMKSYGEGDTAKMLRLSTSAGKIGFSMMALLAIPLIVMMPSILDLWLGDYPSYTVAFARMMVLACMIEQLTRGLVYSCQATGKIKYFSIIVSTIRFLALPLSIVAFICGADARVAMIIFVICESLGSLSRVFIISKLTEFSTMSFINSVIVRVIPPVVIAASFSVVFYLFYNSISSCVLNVAITMVLYAIFCYLITLDTYEKSAINGIVKSFISRIR